MIKKFLMTLVAASVTLISCSSQTRMLKDFPTGDGVTKIVLGPAMMKIAGSFDNGVKTEYGDAFKNVKSVEVYSCDNDKIAKEAQLMFFNLIKNMNLEQTVATEDSGEISNIYTIIDDETGKPSGMIVYTSDISFGELSIVIITGEMKLE